ncbi:hypothetical protein QC823_04070 [Halomonas vilamensis]|uniref:Lipoprotein n=1 Tax=Vreelandella vilamensis TaxID=531309 RepID=A0ABU1H1I4_9GAMM|nr:hypothetical protein [Halomonas vilamensis]MDR5898169.1 hypothetical protein [Halomonas vilamensis]
MSLKKVVTNISYLALIFTLVACSSRYPLDMTEEEWLSLSAEQRVNVRAQQAALDIKQAEERRAAAEARQAAAEAEALEYRSALQSASYGQRVQCTLNGEAYLRGEWKVIEPIAIDTVVGRTLEVDVFSQHSRHSAQVYASFDGQRVQVCDRDTSSRRAYTRCVVLAATQRQFHSGVSSSVMASDFLRGTMRCDLPLRGGW